MIEHEGSLAQQMKKCYLLGYITTKHNDLKLVRQNQEFSSYKQYRKRMAFQEFQKFGINATFSKYCTDLAFYCELLISLCFLVGMLFSYSVKFFKTKRRKFDGCKICPKLNCIENRFITMYTRAGYEIDSLTVVDIPQQMYPYNRTNKVSVFSGISYTQVLRSFWNAVTLSVHMNKKYKKNDYLLRSYSSFPYFLFFYFVDNLNESNELVFYNHYDRWMYLFGNSILKKTYIQHGKLWRDHIHRINSDRAVYLCKSQQEILEYTVFSNKPQASFMKPIELCGFEKLKGNGNKDLLIVCLESFAQKHESVVKQIYGKQINIYLKPHPADNLSVYNNFLQNYPEVVLLGKSDFPMVDYVISYDSTLADEYEMHDISVFKYDDKDFAEKLNTIAK